MFQALKPLIAERGIHILISPAKDGKVGVYVEPVKLDDKEDNAFVTPFRCEGTPEELDAELPGVLAQWLTSRAAVTTSLRDALAAAEAQTKAAADEAKKKAADKNKKPTPATTSKAITTSKAVTAKAAGPVTPSLLDAPASTVGNEDDEGGESAAPVETPAPDAAVVAAPVAEAASPVAVAPEVPVAVNPAPVEPTEQPPAPAAVVSSEPVTAELF
ncbi:MAG: hypothetical protein FD131_3278 [Rhodocyclaceae bacterium]|nr:MAG: hypothetical protein FD131_3278 [Rhodocyclaceae bacterium]